MSDLSRLTVLDCTFRDGGYYNNWEFEPGVVRDYLNSVVGAGIDAVEIGFRTTTSNRYLGPFAYTTDAFLEDLDLSDDILWGVMSNAGDLLKDSQGPEKATRRVYHPRSSSRIGLVRIASHIHQVRDCEPVVRTLKSLGYVVGFNIMQSNLCSDDELTQLARVVSGFDAVDVLYFADSLGNMDGQGIARTVEGLKKGWSGPLGFHGHDNSGRGLSNTLDALGRGVLWLDATMRGMGRGAGNTQTEYLLTELKARSLRNGSLDNVYKFVSGPFARLHERYRWGKNLFYYLAAMRNVHPSYVQDMLGQDGLDHVDVLAVLELLGSGDGHSYEPQGVANAISSRFTESVGSWDCRQLGDYHTALIVAGGPEARHRAKDIESWVRSHEVLVLALNYVDFLPPDVISAYVSCNPARIFSTAAQIAETGRPLVSPLAALPSGLRSRISDIAVLDYGMRVESGQFEAGERGAIVSKPLVASYAFGLITSLSIERVLLAGFDGYDGVGEKFTDMVHELDLLAKANPSADLYSVTPTRYPLQQRSLFTLD